MPFILKLQILGQKCSCNMIPTTPMGNACVCAGRYSLGIAAASRFSFFNWNIIIIAVTRVAIKSDVEYAAQMPFSPNACENMYMSGIRNRIWRVRLRNIDLPASPNDWK